ncbi:MAG TPA: ABC transporter ATP-binding protein [Chloroflexota bacterium]
MPTINSSKVSQPALQASGLSRRFGSTTVLDRINLELACGQRVALLGPNGAGKSTLLRVLSLRLGASAGTLVVGGHDSRRDPNGARRLVGTIGHQPGLYEELSPRENLRLAGRLYSVRDAEARIEHLLRSVELSQVADHPVRTLSRGMQQRVALARAVLHEPLVLLLDEPETGLDAQAQAWLAGLLEEWASLGRAVLLATHQLEWAARVADQTLVMKAGRIVGALGRSVEGAALAAAYQTALAT